MTNAEKFKSEEERKRAHEAWCNNRNNEKKFRCPDVGCVGCAFRWLNLEAEMENSLPCPYCGRAVDVYEIGQFNKKVQLRCTCGYRSTWCDNVDVAISAHNRMARAVIEAEKKEEK